MDSLLISDDPDLEIAVAGQFTDVLLLRPAEELFDLRVMAPRVWTAEWLLTDEDRRIAAKRAFTLLCAMASEPIPPHGVSLLELLRLGDVSVWWAIEAELLGLLETQAKSELLADRVVERFPRVTWRGSMPRPAEFSMGQHRMGSPSLLHDALTGRMASRLEHQRIDPTSIFMESARVVRRAVHRVAQVASGPLSAMDAWTMQRWAGLRSSRVPDGVDVLVLTNMAFARAIRDPATGETRVEDSYLEGLFPALSRRGLSRLWVVYPERSAFERTLIGALRSWWTVLSRKPFTVLPPARGVRRRPVITERLVDIQRALSTANWSQWLERLRIPLALGPPLSTLVAKLPRLCAGLAEECEVMDSLLENTRPRTILLYDEMSDPRRRLLTVLAKRRGIGVVALMHAGHCHHHSVYHRTCATEPSGAAGLEHPIPTLTLAYGAMHQRNFVEDLGYPPSAVCVVGANRTDAILERREAHSSDLNVLVSLSPSQYCDVVVPVLAFLLPLSEMSHLIHRLWMKPHPRVSRDLMAQARRLVSELNRRGRRRWARLMAPSADLSSLIARSGIVIAGQPSTLMQEALAVGSHCVEIRRRVASRYLDWVYPRLAHERYHVVHSMEEFLETVESIAKAGPEEWRRGADAEPLRDLFLADGHVNDRIAGLLKDLALSVR
jgi:hypothetical protein